MPGRVQVYDRIPHDAYDADKALGNRRLRVLGHETRLVRDYRGEVRLRYHTTDIVIYHRDGGITIRPDGWDTLSTIRRLRCVLPEGWTLTYEPTRLGRTGRRLRLAYREHWKCTLPDTPTTFRPDGSLHRSGGYVQSLDDMEAVVADRTGVTVPPRRHPRMAPWPTPPARPVAERPPARPRRGSLADYLQPAMASFEDEGELPPVPDPMAQPFMSRFVDGTPVFADVVAQSELTRLTQQQLQAHLDALYLQDASVIRTPDPMLAESRETAPGSGTWTFVDWPAGIFDPLPVRPPRRRRPTRVRD